MKTDEVSVDVADDAITIQGERRRESEEEREGYYRSERSYGSFCRVVPLPEGAMTGWRTFSAAVRDSGADLPHYGAYVFMLMLAADG